jgi:hypothetical protein
MSIACSAFLLAPCKLVWLGRARNYRQPFNSPAGSCTPLVMWKMHDATHARQLMGAPLGLGDQYVWSKGSEPFVAALQVLPVTFTATGPVNHLQWKAGTKTTSHQLQCGSMVHPHLCSDLISAALKSIQ